VRENLSFRKKGWLEVLGLTFFMIPYCTIVIYFAYVYAMDSFNIGEISASQVGLAHRWIIKSFLVLGFVFMALAGLARLLRVCALLFGLPRPRGVEARKLDAFNDHSDTITDIFLDRGVLHGGSALAAAGAEA